MIHFQRHQWIFAGKLFVAAMLAFALAVHLGLPQPYWSLVTCGVVMNPLSGAIRSKAVYRFAGTFCAGITALFLTSLFASTPILLLAASGLAAATAYAFCAMERTPRSYGFQLYAITMMLLTVAGVDHPDRIFDTTLARVTEISLGIIVTTLVDSALFPASMKLTLRGNLRRWLNDMNTWMNDVFSAQAREVSAEHDRLKTLADIRALSQLTVQLRYDPQISASELKHALAIQHRLLRLAPVLSAIHARVHGMSELERTALLPVFEPLQQALANHRPFEATTIDAIRALPMTLNKEAPWQQLLHDNLADLVDEAGRIWAEIGAIDDSLEQRSELAPELREVVDRTVAAPLPPDFGLAAQSFVVLLGTFALLCGVWKLTGWTQGAGAVLLGVVTLTFYGTSDEPGPAVAQFGRMGLFAMCAGAVFCYGMLPLAADYPTFLIAMALFLVPLGLWSTVNPGAVLVIILGLSSINLQGQYAPPDFATYVEGSMEGLFGIYMGFLGASVFRTTGIRAALQRFIQQETSEIVALTKESTDEIREAYMNRAMDRISSMTTRLAAAGEVQRSLTLLTRLRLGLNIANLKMLSLNSSMAMRAHIEDLLNSLHQELSRPHPSDSLLIKIDQALRTAWDEGQRQSHRATVPGSLVGLRIALFENAPEWRPNA